MRAKVVRSLLLHGIGKGDGGIRKQATDGGWLHYNHHRYYDPTIGRYITSDPIGLDGGINVFSYVGGNSINEIDFTGLLLWVEGAVEGEGGLGFHQSICVETHGFSLFTDVRIPRTCHYCPVKLSNKFYCLDIISSSNVQS